MIDAFGIDRCLWGTDWTRAVKFLNYAQGVDAFRATNRISDSDKAKLMGGNAHAHLRLGAGASVNFARPYRHEYFNMPHRERRAVPRTRRAAPGALPGVRALQK